MTEIVNQEGVYFGNAADLKFGLVPIVIGITGHRDIPPEDEPHLFNAVTKALNEIADQTPNSDHVLLSALAEGADRIAAHAALASGWILGVILPAPVSIYEQDFATEESRSEFYELLGNASWVETLPAEKTEPSAYRASGIRMLRQSLFLLALWDGDESNIAEGGTADIVNLFLHGIPEPIRLGPADNFLPEARAVKFILTRRSRAPNRIPLSDVGLMKNLALEPGSTNNSDIEFARWNLILKQIDLFNSDANSFLKSTPNFAEQIIEEEEVHELSHSAIQARVIFKVSDKISLQAQSERSKQMWWLFGLALAAIFFQQTYSGALWFPVLLGAALVFGFAATVLLRHGKKSRLEEKYLDYRALAEACRVQYFWKRAGVSDCVADHFLRDQRDELEWLRQAVRTTELLPGKVDLDAERAKSVMQDWIVDQLNWFVGDGQESAGKAIKDDAEYRMWSKRAKIAFGLGMATMVLLLLLHIYFGNEAPQSLQWIMVVYGVLFAISGLIEVYVGTKAFHEHARTYRSSGIAFGVAKRNLETAINSGELNKVENILIGVGRDALAENGGWLLLHRDRPTNVKPV